MSTKDIAVSIIVPVYNVEPYLKKCLDSLVNQTLENIEIIAVNDASPDNCISILKEYKIKYPDKFSYIDSPVNLRQGGAKNLGIKAAQGKYIAFIDSDDWVDLDMYRLLYEKGIETNSDIVDADYYFATHDKLVFNLSNSADQIGVLDNIKRKSLILSNGRMVTKIYRKTIFFENNIRFPEHTFYEDNEIGKLPLMYANKLEKVNKPLYYYFMRENSTSHTIAHYPDRFQTSINMLLHLKERGFYNVYKEEIDICFLILYYSSTLASIFFSKLKLPIGVMREMRKTVKEITPLYKVNRYYKTNISLPNRIIMELNDISPLLLFPLRYGYLLFFKNIYRKIIKKK